MAACWCKTAPLSVTTGIGIEEHDHEGRVLTLEMADFFLVCVYTPNSQDQLRRLSYRMQWEDAMRAYQAQGLFVEHEALVLVEREVSRGVQRGLLVEIDLDAYEGQFAKADAAD